MAFRFIIFDKYFTINTSPIMSQKYKEITEELLK